MNATHTMEVDVRVFDTIGTPVPVTGLKVRVSDPDIVTVHPMAEGRARIVPTGKKLGKVVLIFRAGKLRRRRTIEVVKEPVVYIGSKEVST